MTQFYMDHSAEFWPRGWMVWACITVGVFDACLIGELVLQLVRH